MNKPYFKKILLLALAVTALSGLVQAQSPYPQATVRPARHSAPAKAPAPGAEQPKARNDRHETRPVQSQVSNQRFPSRSRPPTEPAGKLERNVSRPQVAPSAYPKATPRTEQASAPSRKTRAAAPTWDADDHPYEDDWGYQEDQPWGNRAYNGELEYYDDDYYYDDGAYYSDDTYYDDQYHGDEPYYDDSYYRNSENSQYRGSSGSQYRNTRPKRKRGGLPRTHLERKTVEFTW